MDKTIPSKKKIPNHSKKTAKEIKDYRREQALTRIKGWSEAKRIAEENIAKKYKIKGSVKNGM